MSNANNRTLTIKRTFSAPLKIVWEAWTQLEHITQWWGPKGMEVKIVEHDFRVGGKWKYTMKMPDGSEFSSDGTWSEIVQLKKIVTSANFRPMTEGVEIETLFEANGNKTEMTFNVIHATEAYAKQQEKMGFFNGWGSTFERLELLVSSMVK